MRILVTDGDNRSALAAVRSLGQKGHRVYAAAENSRNLAACSRHCFCGVAVPSALSDGSAYTKAVADFCRRERIDFVFPMTEQSIYRLNQARSQLPENTVLACPPGDVMQAVSDKAGLFKLAQSIDVNMPKTFHVSGAAGLESMIDKIDCFPVVIKPAFSRIAQGNGFLSGGVRYANNRSELERIYAQSRVLQYPSLIQEKISGPGAGLFTLYDKNRHLAVFSHQRLREKPPSGGVSVVCQSIAPDREMTAAADRLLSAVGFAGVAMVEFKRDIRDGRAKLMEINGRFWGSLQLAIVCGVDFPGLYLDYLQGKKPLPEPGGYRQGHKLKWFFGCLDHLIIRLKNSRSSLHLPEGEPSKFGALLDFLKILEKDASFDVLSPNDPGPFVYEAVSYLRAMAAGK
jgi:predicted ATP-grasp superfamily ATP-dependent carboligase